MKRFFVVLCLLAILVLGCTGPAPATNKTNLSINSFDACVSAGYPVMESYPRQCRTPDGRTFVSQKDVFDINKNHSCAADADCVLVNSELGFSCCWVGACDAVDYSQDKWEAVNRAWYSSGRASYCPTEKNCGPAPGCAARPINRNYTAKCVFGKCAKALLEAEKPPENQTGRPPSMNGTAANATAANATISVVIGECNTLQKSGDMADKLNIIFLPSHHYGKMEKFANDSSSFRDALFDFPFYEENSAKINLFFMAQTSASDGCYLAGNTTPVCNISAMRSLAAGCGFDKERGDQLVVLFDNDAVSTPYARGENEDNILFIGSYSSSIFVHEFSHSFGDLGDTYDGSWNNTIDPEYPNCASDTPGYTCADKWGDLIGTGNGDQLIGCYQNCHAENWYRPTLGGDVMRDSGRNFYDSVALRHIQQQMAEYH